MLLKILDKNKNAIAGFSNHRELCITSSLDFSDKVLSFEAEIADIKDIVEAEGYIETPEDRFVTKELEERSDGTVSVIAQLDVEALEGKAIVNFETVEQTIRAALQLAFEGTGWTISESTVTKKRTLRMTHVSALEVLKQALKTYRCEVLIDSKNQSISIYPQIGEYKGTYFKDNLNLTQLTVKRSSYDFFTEIEPYGKDGIDISSVNNGSKYLTNYTYSTKHKRCIWKDERYTVLANLKDDAQAKLDDMAKPYVSYAGDVIDLARESNHYDVLDYALGDTVDLIDSATYTKEQQRIVGLKVYPEEYWRNELTFANKVLTFDEMMQKYDDAAATVDNITSDNGTINGSTVDAIETRQIVDLENTVVNYAYITDLHADLVTVSDTLTATRGEFGELSANVATFEELTTDHLTALDADINTLRTVDLEAANASIGTLEADYANIVHLLAGNAGIGELQNIHLTSVNTTIDQALIDTLLANKAVIADLIAGHISTEAVALSSNNGAMVINGSLIQFKDANGVVRIQMGKDAHGDFTFVLYDETGQGQLLNADGITASAISDGLIVDDMIAGTGEGYNGISAEKLDISSLFRVLNENGSETLKASRIYFDEQGQNLNQVYTTLTTNISTVSGQISTINETASVAMDTAQQAANTAADALEALKGISTLDALGAQLSNDAHVVHTDYDGSGGDFTYATTTVRVFLGDVEVSNEAKIFITTSEGVTGTWNANTRTYKVTGLKGLNGYIDFDIAYGAALEYILTPDGNRILTPNGNYVRGYVGSTHITKRFSISKSPDGQPGVSYNLIASVDAIRRNMDGTLNPGEITFRALYSDGRDVIAYSGKYMIEVSTNGTDYTQVYLSTKAELSKTYVPPANAFSVRCTLYDTNDVMLDTQSVIVIADADAIKDELEDLSEAFQESVTTVNNQITDISTGIDGLKTKLGDIQTEIHGLSDGEIIVNVGTEYTDTSRIYTVYVYRGLADVKTEYPPVFFKWYMETALGETFLNTGYSTTIQNSRIDRDGCVRLDFVPMVEVAMLTPDGKYVYTPNNKRVTAYVEDQGQFRQPQTIDDIPSSGGDVMLTSNQATPLSMNASPMMMLSSPKASSTATIDTGIDSEPAEEHEEVVIEQPRQTVSFTTMNPMMMPVSISSGDQDIMYIDLPEEQEATDLNEEPDEEQDIDQHEEELSEESVSEMEIKSNSEYEAELAELDDLSAEEQCEVIINDILNRVANTLDYYAEDTGEFDLN